MVSFSRYVGLCVLLAIVFTSGPVVADSECPLDTFELAPTLQLREQYPACYKQITKQIAEKDKWDKYHVRKTRGSHWLVGELKVEPFLLATNTFESFDGGLNVLLDETKLRFGFEAGWIKKKWLRDFWAAIHPESYLKRKATWAIDAWTFTGKVGYKPAINDVVFDPDFNQEFVWEVKTEYTFKFDDFTGDLD